MECAACLPNRNIKNIKYYDTSMLNYLKHKMKNPMWF